MTSDTTTKTKTYKTGHVVETVKVSEGKLELPFQVIETDPNAMPLQTDGPALMVHPIVSDLIDGPILIDPITNQDRIVIKCEGPHGKRWVRLDKSFLNEGYYRAAGFIERLTIVDVKFESKVVKEGGGCGISPTNTQIGYATGNKLISGYVNSKAHTFIPKYDRATGRFMLDGIEIIGAKAMILGDNCIALVVEPIFKERNE